MKIEIVINILKEWNPWWKDSFFYKKSEIELAAIYQKQLNETKDEALKRYNKAKEKYPEWHDDIDYIFYDRFIAS